MSCLVSSKLCNDAPAVLCDSAPVPSVDTPVLFDAHVLRVYNAARVPYDAAHLLCCNAHVDIARVLHVPCKNAHVLSDGTHVLYNDPPVLTSKRAGLCNTLYCFTHSVRKLLRF